MSLCIERQIKRLLPFCYILLQGVGLYTRPECFLRNVNVYKNHSLYGAAVFLKLIFVNALIFEIEECEKDVVCLPSRERW